MKPQQIAVLVVAATLGLLVVLLVLYGRPRRSAKEGMPPNFSRGDPDSVLEGPRLARVQVWGVASAIFITGFLVVYFVAEPFREVSYAKKFLNASVERGEHEFRPDASKGQTGANCAQCHGPDGEGGFAATDANWPAPPLNNIFARYPKEDIKRIITMGRPGTPMPSWGIEFGGPLNEQKIDDIVNFVESLQLPASKKWELPTSMRSGREVFARKCAVCHGNDAKGQGLGQPLPTFFAPDLTTEFYRLGLKVKREEIALDLKNQLLARHADRTDPTTEEIQRALDAVPPGEILKSGRKAAENTIMLGRQNTPMPAWQNRLRPEHIKAVLDYIASIQVSPS
ncbi:MAG TPA: c-type cytochrome [Actinomycetota bacterium]|jgi:mono/diheme cytochrome c family protein|nr:c-type cytochrome [Actinomycetota bacterium]